MKNLDFYLELKAYILDPAKSRKDGIKILIKFLSKEKGLCESVIRSRYISLDHGKYKSLLREEQFKYPNIDSLTKKLKENDIPFN